jgi:hypothetical protein
MLEVLDELAVEMFGDLNMRRLWARHTSLLMRRV